MRNIFLILAFSYSLLSAASVPPPAVSIEDGEIILQTRPGKLYDLQESSNFTDWGSVAGFPAEGTGENIHHEFTMTPPSLFFRYIERNPQLLNLPVPEDGFRMHNYTEFEGPRWPEIFGEGHVTLWHEGKFAAYSITIDDNNSPDFPFWLDVSEAYGWKLTWFVIVHPYVWDIYLNETGTNTGYFGSLEEFKTLSDLGHDIQLHGACGNMNDLSAEEYEDHIVRSVNVLEAATGARILSFAYPCGKLTSADGLHDYQEIISRHMIGARGTTGGVSAVHLLDYLNTKSLGVNSLADGQPASLFSRVYDNSRGIKYTYYRGWCVTLYHGLSDEAAKTKTIETLEYVKANEDKFWVAPFTDVAKYAQERESHSLDVLSVEPDRIEFIVTDKMDDSIFDQPLTVKIRLTTDWTNIVANQAGNPINARIVLHEDVPYVLVEAVPDQGPVVLEKIPAN